MRNMSFFLTKHAFLSGEKDVTRRIGWSQLTLKPGQFFTAIEKGQGLKKGEKVIVLGQCQCISNAPEKLNEIIKTPIRNDGEYWETYREGFRLLTPKEFVEMFCREMKCQPTTTVNRIVFKRLD